MKNPTVSVIMTAYNESETLDNSISSVLESTYEDFEFIIVNDGSTDDSQKLIEKWARKDSRIVPIYQDNTGIVGALNNGLKQAKGEYIARMDGDDTNVKDRFEQQVKLLNSNENVVLVGGFFSIIDESGQETWFQTTFVDSQSLKRALYVRNIFAHGSVMYRREAASQAGGYEEVGPVEDYHLWMKLSQMGDFASIPDCIYIYLSNPTGISASNKNRQIKCTEKVQKDFWTQYPPSTIDASTLKNLYNDIKNQPLRAKDIDQMSYQLLADNTTIGFKMLKNGSIKSGLLQVKAVQSTNQIGKSIVKVRIKDLLRFRGSLSKLLSIDD